MTESGPTGDSASADPVVRKRRWWWLTIAGSVVVLAVVGIFVAVAGQPSQPGQGSPGQQSESPDASADPGEGEGTENPDPSTPGATIDPDFGEPVVDTVVGDKAADFGDRVTARLTELTFITVTGTRAGEVSGPAIRVALELVNGTGETISLGAVTVNAYFGSETQPAPPFDSDTEREPFAGTLATGETARGTYVFGIPEGQEDVVVTVSKSPDSSLVVFRR